MNPQAVFRTWVPITLDDKSVTDAMGMVNVDFADEAQRKRKPILEIGAASKADLAVFVVINKVFDNLDGGHANIRRYGLST